jgi:DNA-binding Lrp family transcriptional regulator
MSNLNPTDYTILEMLQTNARVRMEDIASKTGLSVATVQRRIKALKSEGVIAGEAAVLQPELVGFGMTFLVMVELERERLSELELFRERVCAEPQIQQCYYVTGEFDFIMVALSQDVERFKQLTHRLFFDNPNVKRFRTSLVMDRTKISLSVPLEALNGIVEEGAE